MAATDHAFHPAVITIADPAIQARLISHCLAGLAKKDALDAAAHRVAI